MDWVYNTGSQKLWKERGDAFRRAKDKSNVKLRISSTAKTCDLSANMKEV